MSKFLVTGGAGFIGSNLVNHVLKDAANRVVVVDDLSMGLKKNLVANERLEFIEHSITDHEFMRQVLLDGHFDYVILLAAIASVADSVEHPYSTHQINQQANLFILETIRVEHLPIKKLFFSSSAAVYGDSKVLPKTELTAVEPLTQYAVDKYATERTAINYDRLYGVPTVCARFFNVFGPNQNPSSPYSGVLSIVLESMRNNKPFTFFGDGGQTRDFIYVGDVINGICGLLEEPSAHGQVFNIANGTATSLNQVVADMEKITGRKLNASYEPARIGDIRDSYADASKIDALGFMTHTPIAEGLVSYIASEGLVKED